MQLYNSRLCTPDLILLEIQSHATGPTYCNIYAIISSFFKSACLKPFGQLRQCGSKKCIQLYATFKDLDER